MQFQNTVLFMGHTIFLLETVLKHQGIHTNARNYTNRNLHISNQNLTWQVIPVGCQHHATKFDFSLTDIFNRTQLLPRKVQKISDAIRTTGG